jgi:hypothetical protein
VDLSQPFARPIYGDSRAVDRAEPYLAPTFGNGAGAAGGYRMPGVAPVNVLGGANYGLVDQPRAATGVIRRQDGAAVSRLPVGVTRPAWTRFSLTGLHADYGYSTPTDQASSGNPPPGTTGDCGGC